MCETRFDDTTHTVILDIPEDAKSLDERLEEIQVHFQKDDTKAEQKHKHEIKLAPNTDKLPEDFDKKLVDFYQRCKDKLNIKFVFGFDLELPLLSDAIKVDNEAIEAEMKKKADSAKTTPSVKVSALSFLNSQLSPKNIKSEDTKEPQADYFRRCSKKEEGPPNAHFKTSSTEFAGVAMSEATGRRPTQEDALIALVARELKDLSPEDQKEAFRLTVASMQEEFGKEQKYQGSTLCGTLAWREGDNIKLITTNVGDSTSFLIHLDKDGHLKKQQRLNRKLHHPNEKIEKERIEKTGAKITQDVAGHYRLDGDLQLSRTIGDARFEAKGLSHEPDIDCDEMKVAPGEKVFIVVACDGLTDLIVDASQAQRYGAAEAEDIEALNIADIAKIVQSNQEKKPSEIAKTLIGAAFHGDGEKVRQTAQRYDRLYNQCSFIPDRDLRDSEYFWGSRDNISTAVFQVISDIPTGAFVFDGHGGAVVSNNMGDHFAPRLLQHIQQLKLRASQSAAPPDRPRNLPK